MFALQGAEYEAATFSILYNNSLFPALVILAYFYILNVINRFTTTNFISILSTFRGPLPT